MAQMEDSAIDTKAPWRQSQKERPGRSYFGRLMASYRKLVSEAGINAKPVGNHPEILAFSTPP